ncbi:MAG: septum formation initiator family protein [Calditrichales bacterium]|nr:septum formation initiator family protein [Calditrichales bacterium]
MKAKRKTDNRLSKRIYSILILFGLVLVISLKMYQVFKVDLLMKDLRSLEQQKKQLVSQTEKLEAEVDRLSNIDRIGKIAVEKYNLVNNTDEVIILQLDNFDEFKSLKKKFAERNQKDKTYELAGVH